MQKGKMLILGLLVLAVSTGSLHAQNVLGDFNGGPDLNLADSSLTLLQYEGYDPEAIKAQQAAAAAPMYAGLQNMAFGLWSWKNGDTFGGAITAGLEGGGIALMIRCEGYIPRPLGR